MMLLATLVVFWFIKLSVGVSLQQCNGSGTITSSRQNPVNITCEIQEFTQNVTWTFFSLDGTGNIITNNCSLISLNSNPASCESELRYFKVSRPHYAYVQVEVVWDYVPPDKTSGIIQCTLDGKSSFSCFLTIELDAATQTPEVSWTSSLSTTSESKSETTTPTSLQPASGDFQCEVMQNISTSAPLNISCELNVAAEIVTWKFHSLRDGTTKVIVDQCPVYGINRDEPLCRSRFLGFENLRPDFLTMLMDIKWDILPAAMTYGILQCNLDGKPSGRCFLIDVPAATQTSEVTWPSSLTITTEPQSEHKTTVSEWPSSTSHSPDDFQCGVMQNISTSAPLNISCELNVAAEMVTWKFHSLRDGTTKVIVDQCPVYAINRDEPLCRSRFLWFENLRPDFLTMLMDIKWDKLPAAMTYGILQCSLDGKPSGRCFLIDVPAVPATQTSEVTWPSSLTITTEPQSEHKTTVSEWPSSTSLSHSPDPDPRQLGTMTMSTSEPQSYSTVSASEWPTSPTPAPDTHRCQAIQTTEPRNITCEITPNTEMVTWTFQSLRDDTTTVIVDQCPVVSPNRDGTQCQSKLPYFIHMRKSFMLMIMDIAWDSLPADKTYGILQCSLDGSPTGNCYIIDVSVGTLPSLSDLSTPFSTPVAAATPTSEITWTSSAAITYMTQTETITSTSEWPTSVPPTPGVHQCEKIQTTEPRHIPCEVTSNNEMVTWTFQSLRDDTTTVIVDQCPVYSPNREEPLCQSKLPYFTYMRQSFSLMIMDIVWDKMPADKSYGILQCILDGRPSGRCYLIDVQVGSSLRMSSSEMYSTSEFPVTSTTTSSTMTTTSTSSTIIPSFTATTSADLKPTARTGNSTITTSVAMELSDVQTSTNSLHLGTSTSTYVSSGASATVTRSAATPLTTTELLIPTTKTTPPENILTTTQTATTSSTVSSEPTSVLSTVLTTVVHSTTSSETVSYTSIPTTPTTSSTSPSTDADIKQCQEIKVINTTEHGQITCEPNANIEYVSWTFQSLQDGTTTVIVDQCPVYSPNREEPLCQSKLPYFTYMRKSYSMMIMDIVWDKMPADKNLGMVQCTLDGKPSGKCYLIDVPSASPRALDPVSSTSMTTSSSEGTISMAITFSTNRSASTSSVAVTTSTIEPTTLLPSSTVPQSLQTSTAIPLDSSPVASQPEASTFISVSSSVPSTYSMALSEITSKVEATLVTQPATTSLIVTSFTSTPIDVTPTISTSDTISVSPPETSFITPSETTSITPSETTSITPSETTSITPSETSSITPSETTSITPPETTSITPSETTSITPSETSSITPSETTSITPSETSSITPPETTSITPSETSSITPSETTSITPPETTSISPPETTSITPPETTSISPPETTSISPPETTSISPMETTSISPAETTSTPPVLIIVTTRSRTTTFTFATPSMSEFDITMSPTTGLFSTSTVSEELLTSSKQQSLGPMATAETLLSTTTVSGSIEAASVSSLSSIPEILQTSAATPPLPSIPSTAVLPTLSGTTTQRTVAVTIASYTPSLASSAKETENNTPVTTTIPLTLSSKDSRAQSTAELSSAVSSAINSATSNTPSSPRSIMDTSAVNIPTSSSVSSPVITPTSMSMSSTQAADASVSPSDTPFSSLENVTTNFADNRRSEQERLSIAAIIGSVVAVAAIIPAVIVGIVVFYMWRRNRSEIVEDDKGVIEDFYNATYISSGTFRSSSASSGGHAQRNDAHEPSPSMASTLPRRALYDQDPNTFDRDSENVRPLSSNTTASGVPYLTGEYASDWNPYSYAFINPSQQTSTGEDDYQTVRKSNKPWKRAKESETDENDIYANVDRSNERLEEEGSNHSSEGLFPVGALGVRSNLAGSSIIPFRSGEIPSRFSIGSQASRDDPDGTIRHVPGYTVL